MVISDGLDTGKPIVGGDVSWGYLGPTNYAVIAFGVGKVADLLTAWR